MEVSFDFITGLSFGLEFIQADEDADIERSCFILDIACFRWVFEII